MSDWYRGYDLTIDSAFRIPGAIPIKPDAHPADIVISKGVVEIGPVDITNGLYSRCGNALLLDVPGVARYLAKTSSHLVIDPYTGSDPEQVAALLVATALPMMLWLRGGFVLHAAGLIMPGASAAIAITGPSGIGKSSMAHQLLASGARMLGDDTLLLSMDDNITVASGLPAAYFLPSVPSAPRKTFIVPSDLQTPKARLGAIVVLARSKQATVKEPLRVRGLAAFELLLRNRHRPRVSAIMGRDGTILPTIAWYSRNVPIYRLDISDNFRAAAQTGLDSILDGMMVHARTNNLINA